MLEEATWYQKTCANNLNLSSLNTDANSQFLIVGAGLAGLSTAISLVELGGDALAQNIIVVDQDEPGAGASGRNGGFVFGGYSLSGRALIQQLGIDKARQLYQLSLEGVELIRQRSKLYNIDCDINESGILLANWLNSDVELREYLEIQTQLGQKLEYLEAGQVENWVNSPRYSSGLLEREAFHFHPLKYCQGLARELLSRGVRIYNKTQIDEVTSHENGWQAKSRDVSIECEQIIIAGGGYQLGRPDKKLSRSVLPISTFVGVTEPLEDKIKQVLPGEAAVYDTRFAFDYYRPLADTRILWGGRIGINIPGQSKIASLLEKDMLKVFPSLSDIRIESAWGGWMSYGRHEMPQLGQLKPGYWFAQGFGGHGMAPTTIAGKIMAQAMLAKSDGELGSFTHYPLTFMYGALGSVGAQMVYWYYQLRDRLS